MKNYSKHITNRPQTQPAFGRTDMVQNNAGGYGFKITPQEQLERFLLIGSEGGTYYVGEKKLTEDNAQTILSLIKANGLGVVSTVVDFAVNNRAPKADAGVFVLAMAATYGDAATKKAAYDAISKVAKTSTQLFTFVSNIQNLRGWSKGLCKGVSKFYTERKPEQVAYQMVKYRNRAGFTHKDVIRLAHPRTKDEITNSLFKYAVGKATEAETPSELVQTYGLAQTATVEELVTLIKTVNLTWEMVPTDKLNNVDVLSALLVKMPLTALIRNLNRFSYNGMTKGNTETVKMIVKKLTSEEEVRKAGIHPLMVVNSMFTYSKGRGEKGTKVWEANQNIVDAMTTTFELSLKSLEATGKRILVAVDVSGSMNKEVGGMSMTASQIGNVLSSVILRSEANSELVWFDTKLVNPTIGRRTSIDDVIRLTHRGGGTDCSVPLKHAANTLNEYDAIIILTDYETWAGKQHAFEVLASYRKNVNKDVKVIEVALTSTPNAQIPNDDKNLLRVVGFDASVIEVINSYLK